MPSKVWLTDLISGMIDQRDQSSFSARKVDFIARPSSTARDLWADKLDAVKRLSASCRSVPELGDRIAPILQSRFTLASPVSDGKFVIEYLDGGYRFLDPEFKLRAIGRTFEDSSDMAYGKWIQSTFDAVGASRTELYDDVDAIVGHIGASRHRYCYHRAVCMVSTGAGQAVILSTSLTDADIDLRFETIDKI